MRIFEIFIIMLIIAIVSFALWQANHPTADMPEFLQEENIIQHTVEKPIKLKPTPYVLVPEPTIAPGSVLLPKDEEPPPFEPGGS